MSKIKVAFWDEIMRQQEAEEQASGGNDDAQADIEGSKSEKH